MPGSGLKKVDGGGWQKLRKPKTNAYGLQGWRLPKATYKRARWLVSDFPRIKVEYEGMLSDTPDHEGPPGSGGPGDPTAKIAAKRAALHDDVAAVEKAFKEVPAEYARDVYKHLTEGVPFPDWGDSHTWYEYQRMTLYLVAIRRGY